MQIPTYITNFVEKPLEKAGYSLNHRLNGITRYIRGKYEVNIILDMSAPYNLYLVQRRDDASVYEIMSTSDTSEHYIYKNAPVEEFMEIATGPESGILQAVTNRVTEKILEDLE